MPESAARDRLVELLGTTDAAESFMLHIRNAVERANEQATAAFDFSPHSDGFTYGTTRWRFTLAEVANAITDLPGGADVVVGHLRLGVIKTGNGPVILYPMCIGNEFETDPRGVRVRPSPLRRRLFASPQSSNTLAVQTSLDLDISPAELLDRETGYNHELDLDDATVETALAALDDNAAVVLAAYTSNPASGLLRAFLGQAEMNEDGGLVFAWWTQLDPADVSATLRAVSEPDRSGPSFISGAEPELPVTRRSTEIAVTGTAGPVGAEAGE